LLFTSGQADLQPMWPNHGSEKKKCDQRFVITEAAFDLLKKNLLATFSGHLKLSSKSIILKVNYVQI
jgi:hypothetical protein